jgi:Neuraminidase (sialidase)
MSTVSRLNQFSIGMMFCFLTACVHQPTGSSSFSLPEVISFDVTVNDGVLHALLASKSSDKSPVLLRYLHSEDNGAHWSDAVTVSDNSHAIATRGNDVQLAVAGEHLVALWQTQGELPNMGALTSYYSQDGGKTWHKGNNPAVDNNGDQSHADLLADKQGVFHSVWLADPDENGYQSLRYARSVDGGVHWQPPMKLDDSTCSCCWNTLALAPTGAVNVLYRDMKPRDMAIMQSINHGEMWQRVSTVGEFNWQFDGCPHIGGGLVIADDNTLYSTVWTGLETKAGLYTLRSNDNGKTWTQPQPLGRLASHSDIAVQQQQVVAVWDEREPDGMSIFVAKSQDGSATWSEPKRLSEQAIMASHPRIVATAQGFVAFWTEKPTKQTMQWRVKPLLD